MSPVIVVPMIISIALLLASTAITKIGLDLDVILWKNLIVALVSFLTTAFLTIKNKDILRFIQFLIGIVVVYIVVALLDMRNFNEVINA